MGDRAWWAGEDEIVVHVQKLVGHIFRVEEGEEVASHVRFPVGPPPVTRLPPTLQGGLFYGDVE
jgi:hypothetical protein